MSRHLTSLFTRENSHDILRYGKHDANNTATPPEPYDFAKQPGYSAITSQRSSHKKGTDCVIGFLAIREENLSRWMNMNKRLRLAIVILSLVTTCLAQEGLTVRREGKQKVSATEAEKIYLSACSVVQREFGGTRSLRPRVTLVLGADRDVALFRTREIRLTKWEPHLFAQGVVDFAFEDLMPLDQRARLANRALSWAGATVQIDEFEK